MLITIIIIKFLWDIDFDVNGTESSMVVIVHRNKYNIYIYIYIYIFIYWDTLLNEIFWVKGINYNYFKSQ